MQCTKLGSHLSTLLDHYQQFQEVAESLRTWLQDSETTIGKLLSETVSSDPAVLQEQLASAKVRMGSVGQLLGERWHLGGSLAAALSSQQPERNLIHSLLWLVEHSWTPGS